VKPWSSPDELPNLVTVSLVHTTRTYPAIGWVRANKVASVEVLTEINSLRKQNAELQAAVGTLRPRIENLAALQDEIKLFGTYRNTSTYRAADLWVATCTWSEIFAAISPYMISFPTDEFVHSILASAAFARSTSATWGENAQLDDQMFRTVAVQLQALGLVKLTYTQTMSGGMALFWSNTPSGDRLMLELRTVKKVAGKVAHAAEPAAQHGENG
jgi:hypothetical protein